MNDVIRFPCPGCGKRLKAPAANAGRRARCTCGLTVRVPEAAPQPVLLPLDLDDAPPPRKPVKPVRSRRVLVPEDEDAPARRPVWPWLVAGAAALFLMLSVGSAVAYFAFIRDRRPQPDPTETAATDPKPAAPTPTPATPARGTESEKVDPDLPPKENPNPAAKTTEPPPKPAAKSLPGAAGPRLVTVADPPPGVEVADLFMSTGGFDRPAGGKFPTTFPSGTRSLDVVIILSRLPRDGTSVARRVRSDAGPVKLKGYVLITSKNNATGEITIPISCEPESGSFPDGNYQTDIELGDTVVARLNWSVGGAAEKTSQTAPPAAGGAGLAGEWEGPAKTMKIGPDGKGTYVWLVKVSDDVFSEPVGDLTIQDRGGTLTLTMAPVIATGKLNLEFTVKPGADGTTLELVEKNGVFKPMTFRKKVAPPGK